jgi:phospholipid/cholesterol/gamma-HCH transport system permease protein
MVFFMKKPPELPVVSLTDGVLRFEGKLTSSTVSHLERELQNIPSDSYSVIDGSEITVLDSTGALFINHHAEGRELRGFSDSGTKLLELSKPPEPSTPPSISQHKLNLETIGDAGYRSIDRLSDVLILIVDILYWSVVGLFDRRQYRKGSFTEQAFFMGSSALPIVGVIIFLIGFILALQSAAQLRQFGATIFVVDLLAIGLACEMAPLIVAILVSGRSGSAIASEIATMKFTEELDAIKTMGLNPIRFVVVPKLWAMVVSMPLLTIMALLIGLLGGFFVSISYMGLTPITFYNELMRALFFKDIVTGIIKSLSYAIIITIVGTYRGLTFTGGADGVGRATTSAVVTSLFVIIVADAIWGIIFYFKF